MEVAKGRRFRCLGYLGLGFLCVGFVLQIFGTWLALL